MSEWVALPDCTPVLERFVAHIFTGMAFFVWLEDGRAIELAPGRQLSGKPLRLGIVDPTRLPSTDKSDKPAPSTLQNPQRTHAPLCP